MWISLALGAYRPPHQAPCAYQSLLWADEADGHEDQRRWQECGFDLVGDQIDLRGQVHHRAGAADARTDAEAAGEH